jgi:N-acetylmuramic acid 6-phosphate etherase
MVQRETEIKEVLLKVNGLNTERANPVSANLDRMSSLEFVNLMNREDATVARAIKKVLPKIAEAIDVIVERLRGGGRLIYVGSGTSGRIGALDASECAGTFGTDPSMVQFVIAGGERALAHGVEASEDSAELGRKDTAAKRLGKKDVVVGLAASGRTPYTVAALEYARSKGSAAIAVSCNKNSPLAAVADVPIEVEVGPEVLAGSTRLKAGTAQKLICNMLTTGTMTRLGYVYGNLMVNVHLRNLKLFERGISVVQQITSADRDRALHALKTADMRIPVAIVMLKANIGKLEAARRLKAAQGNVRKVLEACH